MAALLGGREVALACEELALRARGDLDHGRPREAALQLSVALEAALAELEGWREQLGERLDELAGHRPAVAAAAQAALRAGSTTRRVEAEVETALRAARGALAGASDRAALRAPPSARRISSSTSPSRRTAAKRSNGVALMVTIAICPPASMRQLGQPGRRIDLQRGADAEHQVGAGGEVARPGHRRLVEHLAEQDHVGLQRLAAVAARHAVRRRLQPRARTSASG